MGRRDAHPAPLQWRRDRRRGSGQAAAGDGRLDALCADLGIDVLTVFGSALVDPSTARDLDIGIGYLVTAERDVVRTVTELMALAGTDDVDVLVLDEAGPTAKRNALAVVLPLYESEPGRYAQRQMAAMLEFMETDWLRRLDLELLAR